MSKAMVVVVTGANRGIGLSICQLILRQDQPIKLYAASRAGTDLRLQPAHSDSTAVYPELDVTKPDQISALAESIRAADGHVDVLINNAGVAQGNQGNLAQTTLDVNLRGTLAVFNALLPLMVPGGRVVNVSSIASTLKNYRPDVAARIQAVKTAQDADALGQEFLDSLARNTLEQDGWAVESRRTTNAYHVSKALLNIMTLVLASENPRLLINCCCPGWVDTEMGRALGSPAKTTMDGAKIPVRLAIGDIGGTTGKYWANPSIKDVADGQVMDWQETDWQANRKEILLA